MFRRFCRTKPFIDSYSASRDRQSNASPLFFGSTLTSAGKKEWETQSFFHFGLDPSVLNMNEKRLILLRSNLDCFWSVSLFLRFVKRRSPPRLLGLFAVWTGSTKWLSTPRSRRRRPPSDVPTIPPNWCTTPGTFATTSTQQNSSSGLDTYSLNFFSFLHNENPWFAWGQINDRFSGSALFS